MKVLVAGATSVLGRPLLGDLQKAGHEVSGLTRSQAKAGEIWWSGARPAVADVFDLEGLTAAVALVEPEAVISLLVTLPRNGPLRASQVHPNLRLWAEGVPNLIEAARRAGARRMVAESFVFAYGYGQYGPELLTENVELRGGAVIAGQAQVLAGLRRMEKAVVNAEGLDGIVLRYGGLHGAGVPMTATMAKALRHGVPVLPGGGHALLPFIELSDAVRGTEAALSRGRGGQIYNLVDDRAAELRDYATALSASVGGPPPRSIPLWLLRPVAPYMACIFDHTRLPVSNEKAKRALAWEPRYPTFERALV
jgi:nucleoside-diphosphate-sugar epimerase